MFFLRTYLWIAPNVLLLLTLVGIFRRKRRTQHPVFATYVVSQLAYFLSTFTFALVAARNAQSRTVYLWMLVVGLGLSAILEMAVLYELTAKLIFSRLRNSSTLRTIFRWAMGLLVLLGVVAAASVGSSGPERLINVFQNLNIGVYVIALGLLFAIALLTKTLSIPWRSLPAGIALGFGIAATGELAGSGLLSEFGNGKSGYIAADLVRLGAFHICALIWLIYVLLPDKRRPDSAPVLSIGDLESRAEELRRMVQR